MVEQQTRQSGETHEVLRLFADQHADVMELADFQG
jgi:hypothetical protein